MQRDAMAEGELLMQALCQPGRLPHGTGRVERIETHISWLLLTGTHAYKLKKPVDFGFVDFTTLEKRRHCCEEELRLNRRFAPELYLRTLPITGSIDDPRPDGAGPAIEYAVEMVEFPAEARLDRMLAAGDLTLADCNRLAETIARGHVIAEVARPESPHGEPSALQRQIVDTLAIARDSLPDARAQVDSIQAWCERRFAELEPVMQSRREGGFVRECHGDLHLENMLFWNDRFLLFDCLEFNPRLRWIDVMSDIAFVTMDLADRGRVDMAQRLLNHYLELTGDFAGLAPLRYYQVYRAVVRAAVAGMRLGQTGLEPDEQRGAIAKAGEYLELAISYMQAPRRWLVITCGCSGSGKTTVTQAIVDALGAIRLRSDIERQRVEASPETPRSERYARATRRRVYEVMAETAETVLHAGFPAVLDATFLARDDRALMRQVAERLGVPFVILNFDLAPEVLRERITARTVQGSDASEATLEVLAEQLAQREPLDEGETRCAIDMSAEASTAALVGAVQQLVRDRGR